MRIFEEQRLPTRNGGCMSQKCHLYGQTAWLFCFVILFVVSSTTTMILVDSDLLVI